MLERVWRKGNPLALLVGMQIDTATMEDGMETAYKARNKTPPYDPAIPLIGIYPEEIKTEKDTCTSMFTAAIFTIARTWKQPRCPLIDEWIKKLWYIQWNTQFSSVQSLSRI